jgi:hypothetical protein
MQEQGDYYKKANPRTFTAKKLKAMGHSSAIGSPEGADDDGDDKNTDDYGRRAARDSSEFKRGGAVHGAAKRPHLGRAGRASGGRVEGKIDTNMKKDGGMRRIAEHPLVRFEDGEREARARGGRTGKGKTVVNVVIAGGKGDHEAPPPHMAAPPPPMPAPPPQRPVGPPMGQQPPIMMPPAGAPMGPAGAPPQGPPPPRARGGRVANLGHYAHPPKSGFSDGKAPHRGPKDFSAEAPTAKRAPEANGHKSFGKGGTHSFGKGGTPARASLKEHAGNNGRGRIEKARREA